MLLLAHKKNPDKNFVEDLASRKLTMFLAYLDVFHLLGIFVLFEVLLFQLVSGVEVVMNFFRGSISEIQVEEAGVLACFQQSLLLFGVLFQDQVVVYRFERINRYFVPVNGLCQHR